MNATYHANMAHFQKRVEEVLGVISGNVSQDIRKFITSAYADELEMEYLKIKKEKEERRKGREK